MIHPMRQDASQPIILVADVGGTNLSLALLVRRPGGFEVLRRDRGSTQGEISLLQPAKRFLEDCARNGLCGKPDAVCVSGAGTVKGRTISLTNAGWEIDGAALEAELGVPVRVIHDFAAISRGVLMLSPEDAAQLTAVPHPDGHRPAPDPEGTVLVVGAGTGLGVGFITRRGGCPQVFTSEGGHIGLPILDEDTIALWRHLRKAFPAAPGAEAAVSGPGIGRIFGFLLESGRTQAGPLAERILALPPEQRPAAISGGADADATCKAAMDLFVELYARVAAELCAVFLPSGGLYLAGGIAAKNEARFLAGNRFMAAFERNYRSHIDEITRSVPVFIVRDYDISLYGAASAACDGLASAG